MKFNLAKYALDNKPVIWFFLALLTIGGVLAFNSLPKKEDAPFVVKQAVLVCQYPGAETAEVERSVTTVIEREVQTMPNVYKLKGESHPGFSYITVELLPGTDPSTMSQMWDELRKKVYNVQPKLPQGAGKIVVNDDFGDVFGIYFALTGDDGISYGELRDKAQEIKTLLNPIEGVAKINTFAEQTEVVDVFVMPEQLAAHGISPAAIMAALGSQNRLVATGTKNSGELSVTVIAGGTYGSVEDIRAQLVSSPDGGLVPLGQIARVSKGYYEPAQMLMRVNGTKAIGIAIATSQQYDVVKVGSVIRRAIDAQVMPLLPYGFSLEEIYPEDTIARQANDDFFVNLAISVATVILLLFFFYKLRATVLIGTSLIFSIAATLFTMQFLGTGLNRSSLAAFIIAMGMLVDNAIVVTDNARTDIKQGMKRRDALIDGATRPMWGLLGATVIGIISFLPIYLADSAAAEIVHPLFIVLTLSLGFSWILSQTQTPLFGSFMLKEAHGKKVSDPYDTKAYNLFGGMLGVLIRRRWLTIGTVVVLLVASVAVLRRMPSDFFPNLDKPYFRADLFLPDGYGIDATSAQVAQIEGHLISVPGVVKVSSAIGGSHPRYYLASTSYSLKPNFANILVEIADHKQTAAMETDFYDYVTANYPDIICRSSRFKLASPADGAVEILFSGEDADTLQSLADSAMELIRTEGPRVEFLRTNWGDKVPVYIPEFSEQKGERLGITRLQMAEAIQIGTMGMPMAEYRERDLSLPVLLRAEGESGSLAGLAGIPVFGSSGNSVPMAQVADGFDVSWQYNTLWHFQRRSCISVRMEPPHGGNVNDVFEQVWSLVNAKIKLPEGYAMSYQGEQDPQDQANGSLRARLPMAFILMVVVLLFLFRNFRDPLAILAMLPMILVGVVIGLLALGKAFDFFALLGLLGLVGMNIKSAVILVSEISTVRREGKEPFDAVIYAAKNRLVPVTTGAAATIVGMAPLLGDAMFGGMAATIMGGLLMATILTILVLPVTYCAIHKIKAK